jgi:hypothetical protein
MSVLKPRSACALLQAAAPLRLFLLPVNFQRPSLCSYRERRVYPDCICCGTYCKLHANIYMPKLSVRVTYRPSCMTPSMAGVTKCNTDKTDCKVFWRKVSHVRAH